MPRARPTPEEQRERRMASRRAYAKRRRERILAEKIAAWKAARADRADRGAA